MKDKIIFKFNNGISAILCSGCRVIVKTGNNFTNEEKKAMKGFLILEPYYCNSCKVENKI